MAERSKAHAWKACIPFTGYRGFESLSLRRLKMKEKKVPAKPSTMKTKRFLSTISATLLFLFLLPAPASIAQGDEGDQDTTSMASDTAGGEKDTSMAAASDTGATDTTAMSAGSGGGEEKEEKVETEKTVHQVILNKFLEGGPWFMSAVLLSLIIGLALSIERIIYLNVSTTNTEKLLNSIENALQSGGVEEAKQVCRETKGPIASIFYQGLDRSHEGVDVVEKSVISYGGVQMGLLEKGLSWIQLFIAIAPMLGFMGTVFGMIEAFSDIAEANNISPKIVASGIQKALITTVSGLMVGIALQIFYNYIVSKVDSMVNDMENASISLVDLLVKHNVATRQNNQ
jgi:biopolymer transport protein ExbB